MLGGWAPLAFFNVTLNQMFKAGLHQGPRQKDSNSETLIVWEQNFKPQDTTYTRV